MREVDLYGIWRENVLLAMQDITFSKDNAAMIVGGTKKLERLISQGKIRAEKRTPTQNGKWFCNGADVLMHCRNMRGK